MANYTRYALYNGNRWEMGDTEVQTFLNDALAVAFPDLRNAKWTEEVDEARKEIRYTFSKAGGGKGC